MPSHVLSVAAQSQNARAVRTAGKNLSPNLRIVARGPALSAELIEALDAVTQFGKQPALRRHMIERTVDALIVLLDHIDLDMEPDEDRCDAGEDFGGESIDFGGWAGDPEDAECNGDIELDGSAEDVRYVG